MSHAREAALGGWVILHATPGVRSALSAALALPQARVMMPSRGPWICH